MTDQEKVLNGLQECLGAGQCTKCLYKAEAAIFSCRKLLNGALTVITQNEQRTDEAKQILEHILEADPRTLKDPEFEYAWIFERVYAALKNELNGVDRLTGDNEFCSHAEPKE